MCEFIKLEPGSSEKKRNRTRKILNFPTGTVNRKIIEPQSEPLEAKNYLMITSIVYLVLSAVALSSKSLIDHSTVSSHSSTSL